MNTSIARTVNMFEHPAMRISSRNPIVNSPRLLLADFMTDYLQKCHKTEEYKQMHLMCARQIGDFSAHIGSAIYTDSVSEHLFEEFVYYLQAERNLMSSTVKGTVQRVKSMLQKASNAGHDVNRTFRDFSFRDDEIDTVFLTKNEIARVYYYENLTRAQEEVRDLFVLGCMTGLRYSDYSRLTAENFIDGKIVIRTKKTKTPVQIPMHPFVREIVKKYDGGVPRQKTIQHFNFALKQICKQIGLNEIVPYERRIGLNFVCTMRPKWQLISSHTARRSAATNMYLDGIPTYRIMLLTGHKTENAFFRYVRITREENAMALSGHKFFN